VLVLVTAFDGAGAGVVVVVVVVVFLRGFAE